MEMEMEQKIEKIISLKKELDELKKIKTQFLEVMNGKKIEDIEKLPDIDLGDDFGITLEITLDLKLRRYAEEKQDFEMFIFDLLGINEVELLKLYFERLNLKINNIEEQLKTLL